MKDLITDLGHLVAFKKLNRDDLAEAVGTTRQNLISAFKGRRPLPTAQLPPLRRALGLDDNYRFELGRVHALTVNQGETQRNLLLDVLWRVMSLPVRRKWILRGIGEANRMGLAYVFEDDDGAWIAVRNDDALLAKEPVDTNGVEKDEKEHVKQNKNDLSGLTQLFSLSDDSPEREITLDVFNTLFQGGMSLEDLRSALASTSRVWTWARLREKAEQVGQNAENAARALGLADGVCD